MGKKNQPAPPKPKTEEPYTIPETCCYCKFHVYQDHLSHHICEKEEGDRDVPCDGTCKKWKNSGKFQNVKDKT